MGFDCYAVRFGAPATALLAGVVGAHRAGDPFAPVVVLVPDNLTGVMARRSLGAQQGFVNVSFVTPAGLASRVAPGSAPELSPVVRAGAVRAVLAEQTRGMFAPVAAHPATELALVVATRTLAGAAPDTLTELEHSFSPRTRAVVALHRDIATRLRGLADEHEQARAAVAAVRADASAAVALGSLVVHLVDELAPAHLELLRALGEVIPVTVLIGTTGVAAADAPLDWWAHAIGDVSPSAAAGSSAAAAAGSLSAALAVAPTVFTATDSDDEVRHAVRELLARAEAGVPFARMALLHTSAEPYARLVHEQLAAACITHNGPAIQSLAASVAGRAATKLLALASGRWSRDEVIDLVTSVPGLDAAGQARPVAQWDTASRVAAVVAGLDDWRAKLARPGLAHEARVPAPVVASLRAFVEELAACVERGRSLTSWPELAAWFADALTALTGDTRTWPEAEATAHRHVLDVIADVAALGPFDTRPGLPMLTRALATALEVPSGRLGKLGVGVQVGPVEHARALDADLVVVVGLAEGLCPAPPSEDTLLPDAERAQARHGELALATSRVGVQHRALLAALAAARVECVLGFPRGDHRGGRTRLPSRWLLDLLAETHGHRPTTADLLADSLPGVEHIASFEAGLAVAVTPAHAAERRLQVLRVAGAAALVMHPLHTPGITRGFAAIAARRSPAFTEWDANLAGYAVPSPAAGVVLSPTRLESWAACPFRYYLKYVLGLGARDSPEEIDQVSALERGSLVHTVLERFIDEAADAPPAPHEPWSPAHAERLHAIAVEVFADAEARGVTGPATRWRRDQVTLHTVLDAFLHADSSLRAGAGTTPHRVELAFGMRDEPPLVVELPGGREVRFRGSIDRVDRNAGGDVVVYDYKTGKGSSARSLDHDVVAGGTRLQLPVYARAAAAALGAPAAGSSYWYLEVDRKISYPLTPATDERFLEALGTIVDGIDSGMFLANPGEYNAFFRTHDQCGYCEFDRVCRRERGDSWTAKTSNLTIAEPRYRYLKLLAGPVANTDADTDVAVDAAGAAGDEPAS